MSLTLLADFGIKEEAATIEAVGNGLINDTWVVKGSDAKYILQRINSNVFKDPQSIAFNIDAVAEYLAAHYPDYIFIAPATDITGKTMVYKEDQGFFRMFPYVNRSHTVPVVETPEQAYEAAKQFGRFTRMLKDFDSSRLKITIPDFHNLVYRYNKFLHALKYGNASRIFQTKDLCSHLKRFSFSVVEYEKIKRDKFFYKRVTHHDTKISNVLFDENNKGICVIDLDTLMPGFFISDTGDMMRTYLSPAGEEEQDLSKIEIRDDVYTAIVSAYCGEMNEVLSKTEKEHFFYSGLFMIYMQALRFITDYLEDDIYYGEKYPEHNLYRAKNQFMLLQRLLEKEKALMNKL